jgi:hypothetical protein
MRTPLFLFCFLLLACCAGPGSYQTPSSLQPVRPIDRAKSGSYEIDIEARGQIMSNFIFAVTLTNDSNQPLRIDPAKWYYEAYNVKRGRANKYQDGPNYAIDAREQLTYWENRLDTIKKAQNPYSLDGKSAGDIAVEGLVTGSIALLFGQDNQEVEQRRRWEDEEWEDDFTEQVAFTEQYIEFWRTEALKDTIIGPGGTLKGKILLPVNRNAQLIRVHTPLAGEKPVFPFKQH